MKITVQDANILIDLELSGTLGLWFELGVETHTTDLILAQVEKGGHHEVLAFASSGMLRIQKTSSLVLLESTAWLEKHPELEIEDVGAFLLARELKALLLTGDQELRLLAEVQFVEVHGTLWIFDKLIEAGILKPALAADRLEYLLVNDRYLPREECLKRIKKWREA